LAAVSDRPGHHLRLPGLILVEHAWGCGRAARRPCRDVGEPDALPVDAAWPMEYDQRRGVAGADERRRLVVGQARRWWPSRMRLGAGSRPERARRLLHPRRDTTVSKKPPTFPGHGLASGLTRRALLKSIALVAALPLAQACAPAAPPAATSAPAKPADAAKPAAPAATTAPAAPAAPAQPTAAAAPATAVAAQAQPTAVTKPVAQALRPPEPNAKRGGKFT